MRFSLNFRVYGKALSNQALSYREHLSRIFGSLLVTRFAFGSKAESEAPTRVADQSFFILVSTLAWPSLYASPHGSPCLTRAFRYLSVGFEVPYCSHFGTGGGSSFSAKCHSQQVRAGNRWIAALSVNSSEYL